MPEVASLICDRTDCRQIGIRYWYYTVAGRQREVILCPDHNLFVNDLNRISRPAKRVAPRVKRRPTVTAERLDAIYVDEDDE